MKSLVLVTLLIGVPSVLAQPPDGRLAMSVNLREALERSGFDDGIRTDGRPDLERKLTSSAFGTSPDTFVAGYFFEDELEAGQGLGPLRVSLFDRSRRKWVHKGNVVAELERLRMRAGGSVVDVTVHPGMVLLDTHANPSAGFIIVLDRSLNVITSLGGYGAQVTNEGAIWYFGNMVHFADTHQQTLKIFDVNRRSQHEIFPGPNLSPVAEAYRRQIKALRRLRWIGSRDR